ncbi:HAD family hydrolase [Gracilibacillus suaedae]|uniref:haloacid dehalogenase n=1 Tax=Gracilibacillus suaedae TaxID=2820273 RepID=UPI001ABE41C0|nr:haloacid dehalogenase [Gracilibacillus suaedae]
MNKFQLVLDVGGVLATDLDLFWEELVNQAGLPYDKIRAIYKTEIRKQLWQGDISERDFWQWLSYTFPKINLEYLQIVMQKSLVELEGIQHIEKWNTISDIHILSNHRTEWLQPIINRLHPFLTSTTVSANVGVAKPEQDIYEICHKQLDSNRPILFVDNKKENLAPARELGWQTIHADSDNKWIAQVDQFLSSV